MIRSIEFTVTPIATAANLRTQVYEALKAAIGEIDIYGSPGEIRLDERRLARDLGVSRTPVREAFTVLEQEGFVRSEARRGVFVVRKTKRQIIGMIHAWAALEGMAARLACQRATDEQIASLETLFSDFLERSPSEHIDAYSEANICFHQAIIALAQCRIFDEMSGTLMMHVRGIRRAAIRTDGRADRSNAEHRAILRALRDRACEDAEQLVRAHGLGLAAHVERNGDALR